MILRHRRPFQSNPPTLLLPYNTLITHLFPHFLSHTVSNLLVLSISTSFINYCRSFLHQLFNMSGYPPQGYPPQGYPQQGGYPPQGYYQQGPPVMGPPQGYYQQQPKRNGGGGFLRGCLAALCCCCLVDECCCDPEIFLNC